MVGVGWDSRRDCLHRKCTSWQSARHHNRGLWRKLNGNGTRERKEGVYTRC